MGHLNDFPLAWRFTEPNHNVLPAEVLARFEIAQTVRASKFFETSLEMIPDRRRPLLNRTKYPSILPINASGDVRAIQVTLGEQFGETALTVAVSWDPELAVLVTLKDFIDYWDDFCYPLSDDVVVFPENREWFLFYHHEETFFLGDSRLTRDNERLTRQPPE